MEMLSNPLVSTIKDIVKVNRRKTYIDNIVFRCHYRWAVMILSFFAILVTSRQYIGDPIDCLGSGDVKKIMDQYCWIHSTFTRGKFEKGKWRYEAVKETEIHPGIRPANVNDDIIYHTYYQWVWCFLLLQACAFYFPHWCWEKREGGRTRMLVANLNLPMMNEEKKRRNRQGIVDYFKVNRGFHTRYAFDHLWAELMNLANVLSQLFATDYFLNYEFSKYGFRLFELTQTRPYLRDDALSRVFPTVTACRVATGGVAFGIVQHDILCVLPINILNEKIYIFLWFMFMGLAGASITALVYRVMTFCIPPLRKVLLKGRARVYTDEIITTLTTKSSYGDWFLIYKLGQNMDPVAFSSVIKMLADSFERSDESGGDPERCASPSGTHPTEKALLDTPT